MSIKIFFRRKQHEKPEKAAVEVKLKSKIWKDSWMYSIVL